MQLELYPNTPGYKTDGPSKEAAKSVASRAATLREQVFKVLSRESLTADEVAQKLGETVLSIRPRLSELATKGLIEDAGLRRRNESGKMATVWSVR